MSTIISLQALFVMYITSFESFCSGSIHMMWIQHPEVQNYYNRIRKQNGSFSSITTITKREKKELCESRITVFAVRTHQDGHDTSLNHSKMMNPVLYPFNYNAFTRKYAENLPEDSTEYVHILVNTGSEIFVAEALPCLIYGTSAWYIINGYEKNLYFIAEKSEEGELFRLAGMLEPYPKIHLYRRAQIQELEEKFLIGQRWVALTKRRTSLCKLDSLQKFRLCSTIFVAWRNLLPLLSMAWYRMRDINGNGCLRQIILSSERKEYHELSRLPVDLVICPTKPDEERLKFYITADETGLNSVFAVTPKSVNGKRKYVLSAYITDVTVLKNAMSGDFMVETFIQGDPLDYY